METVELTQAELDALPEYSMTLPTISVNETGGVTGIVRWKRDISDTAGIKGLTPVRDWYLGEYPIQVDPNNSQVPIRWRKVVIDG